MSFEFHCKHVWCTDVIKVVAVGGRTTQMFINFRDNSNLDMMGFPPIGTIVDDGMKIAAAINTEYGEGAPSGRGPSQGMVQARGNAYLKADFPNLDYIKAVTLVK